MKDLDNNIGFENKANDIHENKDFSGKVIDNVVSPKDLEQSSQENKKTIQKNSQGIQEKDEDNKKESQSIQEEGENSQEKGKTCSKESENCEKQNVDNRQINSKCSSYYAPPYYHHQMTDENTGKIVSVKEEYVEQNDGKSWRITIAVLASVTVIMFLITVGMFLSTFLSNMKSEELTMFSAPPKVEFIKSEDDDNTPKTVPEVVAKVGDSVVEISGVGSGVIVTQSDKAGYLLTNYHVISNNGRNITVVLSSGKEYRASVVSYSDNLDLAVLRIEKKEKETFTQATWGDSAALEVGEEVIAIGNPLGSLGGTVTDGIISALDREVKVEDKTMTLLQHNAAINPGNSGGGLFDMNGNLIGIVNAKKINTGIEGLGFAIPSEIAFDFFNRVISMYADNNIGIEVAYMSGKTNPAGMYITDSTVSGLAKRDRVIMINDIEISGTADYYTAISDFKKGDSFSVTVERYNDNGTKNSRYRANVIMK